MRARIEGEGATLPATLPALLMLAAKDDKSASMRRLDLDIAAIDEVGRVRARPSEESQRRAPSGVRRVEACCFGTAGLEAGRLGSAA